MNSYEKNICTFKKGMNYIMNLLVFVIIPIATILLSVVLERILRSPILVAITFLAIYLIIMAILFVTGVITDLALGVVAIIGYIILAFISAIIVRFIKCICRNFLGNCCNLCPGNNENNSNANEEENECCYRNEENRSFTNNCQEVNNYLLDNNIKAFRGNRFRRF